MGSIRSIAVGEEKEVFFGNYFWNWVGLLLNRVIPFSCPRVVSHLFGNSSWWHKSESELGFNFILFWVFCSGCIGAITMIKER